MFVQQLPWLLFALPAGVYVDRLDRRHLIVSVNLVRAAVVGGLAVGGAALGALCGGLIARGLGITAPFWIAFGGMVVLTAVAWRRFSPALLDVTDPLPLRA